MLKMLSVLKMSSFMVLSFCAIPGCGENPVQSEEEEKCFVCGSLKVTVELSRFPALNEETTVYLQSSLENWLRDSLHALAVDSIQLGVGFGVQDQENNGHAYPAFLPNTSAYLLTQLVDIKDTTHWQFNIRAIRTGKFSLSAGVGPVSFRETEDPILRNLLKAAWGFDSLTICVEEDQGYDCFP